MGEVGMVAAPAAVYGAVLDALRPFGVSALPMPCDPESVWRAINSAALSGPERPPAERETQRLSG